jgi:hypothetical protein
MWKIGDINPVSREGSPAFEQLECVPSAYWGLSGRVARPVCLHSFLGNSGSAGVLGLLRSRARL